MTPPEPDAAFAIRLRYKLRGLFGLLFTVVSAYSIWKMVFLGLMDLK